MIGVLGGDAVFGGHLFRVQLDAAPATNQLPIVARYDVLDRVTFQKSENSTITQTNGTTPVDIVPGSFSDDKDSFLVALSIVNADTAARVLTFTLNDGVSVTRVKWVVKLAISDTFVYEWEKGFTVFKASGEIK